MSSRSARGVIINDISDWGSEEYLNLLRFIGTEDKRFSAINIVLR